jgi:pyruvate/2-oxoglutarate dehydrogenase complex dihydrolipoamide dehydrogenase (E3) component
MTNSRHPEAEIPEHLVVVGGSYIGLEFAQMYRRFGAEVTVVEKGERLIAREDPEVSDAIRDILEAEGITIRTGADLHQLQAARRRRRRSGSTAKSGDPRCDRLPCAARHRPQTEHGRSGLDKAGIATDKRGYIIVTTSWQTNVGHLGAGRLQRARRLHPHGLQRFRDRRRQSARRRGPQGERSRSRLMHCTSIPRWAGSG